MLADSISKTRTCKSKLPIVTIKTLRKNALSIYNDYFNGLRVIHQAVGNVAEPKSFKRVLFRTYLAEGSWNTSPFVNSEKVAYRDFFAIYLQTTSNPCAAAVLRRRVEAVLYAWRI